MRHFIPVAAALVATLAVSRPAAADEVPSGFYGLVLHDLVFGSIANTVLSLNVLNDERPSLALVIAEPVVALPQLAIVGYGLVHGCGAPCVALAIWPPLLLGHGIWTAVTWHPEETRSAGPWFSVAPAVLHDGRAPAPGVVALVRF